MNRTVVSGFAAFALLIGAGLAMNVTTAEAGHCGGGLFARLHAKHCGGGLFSGLKSHGCGGGHGLFAKKSCGGGLLARLKAKHAAKCCAPAPACAPAPEPCCAPEPEPCCAPEPEPCCAPEPAPCCGDAAPVAAPCCDGAVMEGATMSTDAGGYDLAPGETLVPGSVETVEGGGELSAPASSSDEAAEEAAPPAPTPDASTDA